MNSKTIRTLIIVGVLLITFLWIKGSYNTLVDNDVKLTTSWSNVEVAYQTRADKIIQLNAAVQTYNLNVRKFPSNIFAGIFGFEKKSGFAADKGAEKRVDVKGAFSE